MVTINLVDILKCNKRFKKIIEIAPEVLVRYIEKNCGKENCTVNHRQDSVAIWDEIWIGERVCFQHFKNSNKIESVSFSIQKNNKGFDNRPLVKFEGIAVLKDVEKFVSFCHEFRIDHEIRYYLESEGLIYVVTFHQSTNIFWHFVKNKSSVFLLDNLSTNMT